MPTWDITWYRQADWRNKYKEMIRELERVEEGSKGERKRSQVCLRNYVNTSDTTRDYQARRLTCMYSAQGPNGKPDSRVNERRNIMEVGQNCNKGFLT